MSKLQKEQAVSSVSSRLFTVHHPN